MKLHRTYIEDIFDVISEIQKIYNEDSAGYTISDSRKRAVRSVAKRELDRNRFINFDSAEKSIHDACSRRLKPFVQTINDFDVAVDQWLSGNPEKLKLILATKIKTNSNTMNLTPS